MSVHFDYCVGGFHLPPACYCLEEEWRFKTCTDFSCFDAPTFKDAHPLPHQADALAALGGAALPFFFTMDLTSGYYNVKVHEENRKYIAFTSPFGFYEYNRLPQGLCNSPATDACEHRWVARLALYQFSIRYIPGSRNDVAEALSREPFVKQSALHFLMRVPYDSLLRKASAVQGEQVQDVFRWSAHPSGISEWVDGLKFSIGSVCCYGGKEI